MSLVVNGKIISIAEYASLIIQAAKRIIEREQQGHSNAPNQQQRTAAHTVQGASNMAQNESNMTPSGDMEEGTPVDAQSVTENQQEPKETPLSDGQTTDVSSVLLRLPDGSLQSVEEYIMNIIRDASSLVEEDHTKKEQTTTKQNTENQGDTCEMVPGATATPTPQDGTPDSKCKKQGKVKRTTSLSKVFNRLFHRGKSKDQSDKEEPNNLNKESTNNTDKPDVMPEVLNHATESGNTDVQISAQEIPTETEKSEEGKATECKTVNEKTVEKSIVEGEGKVTEGEGKVGEVEGKVTEVEGKVTEGEGKEVSPENKEIKPRKQRKKGNSFRKMLSCFSSKSAQVD